MNIKLGEKIRQLRIRDNRKQEDLAKALGVSSQAVSRWEANGGYPDLDLIPAIANYFCISIDELFGYSMERREKLSAIFEKADSFINAQCDMTECVKLLRDAADEFPSEPQVFVKLGQALSMLGWKKQLPRLYHTNDTDYTHTDVEYNSKNEYLYQAITAYEKALTFDIPVSDRDVVTSLIVSLYSVTGQFDKATALAQKQASVIVSREVLMASAAKDEEREKYRGEALIALLTQLCITVESAYCENLTKAAALISFAQFCESVFCDGKCGMLHNYLTHVYVNAATLTARFGKDTDTAFEYFKKGFDHYKAYCEIPREGEYRYTAPLVSKVTFTAKSFPIVPDFFWKNTMNCMTDELKERIEADPYFAECFD